MEQELESIVEDILNKEGFLLVELIIDKWRMRLKVVIYREDAVAIHDCEQVARAIKESFGVRGIMGEDFSLEVSSPGINRVLKTDREYNIFSGRMVELKYRVNQDVRKMRGKLEGREGDRILISDGGENLEFNRSDIINLRLC